jgi:hypothetical protein
MMRQPYQIKPLDNRLGSNGYPQSDYRNNPANREFHAIAVDRFRIWRENELRATMRRSMKEQRQRHN